MLLKVLHITIYCVSDVMETLIEPSGLFAPQGTGMLLSQFVQIPVMTLVKDEKDENLTTDLLDN